MKVSVAPLLLAVELIVAVHASKILSSENVTHQNCGVQRDQPHTEQLVRFNLGAVRAWQMAATNQKHMTWPHQPKVAFVFLVVNDWPMEGVWADWLAGQDKNKYKVVIHSKTGSWRPKHDIFAGSELHHAVPTGWCRLADALLEGAREALKDESVVQVVTMCMKTAPVKSFAQVYSELTKTPLQTRLCIDDEWKNRGMPFSYTWARRDAELFTQSANLLHGMFTGVHNCDLEDFFVIAAKLANRPYQPDCVTWSGWDPKKGFARTTNGQHYTEFLKDPLNKMATRDWCIHPVTVEELSERSIDSLIADPKFLFARKLTSDNMKINSDAHHHVTLQAYLKPRISQPAQ